MPRTPPDAAPDLRQYLDKLPNVASLRERLGQLRNEGKLLRRLMKLAAEAEAAQCKPSIVHTSESEVTPC